MNPPLVGGNRDGTKLAESGLLEAFRAEMADRPVARGDSAMTKWILRHRAELVFSGFIIAGILIHYVPESWLIFSWLYSVSRPLSDSLMVAGLLGLTVDRFLKRALIRDVGAVFIGWSLPQEVRNYLR